MISVLPETHRLTPGEELERDKRRVWMCSEILTLRGEGLRNDGS